ncbi:hypothetical protein TL16_g12788 [Triparma laevis f. inornata]|uniref:A to I editase domain-containing protein n=1 Tax=Triparma laevis f. inornata TaxID=1714386 RepID=A0A9W7EW70_9STRA|nr:hypothetical protein TL16_g12788 [Triparma laevis f. inornata]
MCVNELYSSLPNRGKPPSSTGEWTVLSAIVCHNETSKDLHVVSLATGSKCCGPGLINEFGGGRVLHDSHAEVLARRGLVYAILREILDGSSLLRCPLLHSKSPPTLNPALSFHLYISESPCGDAAIYPLADTTNTTNFTGAKIVSSHVSTAAAIATTNTNTTTTTTNNNNDYYYTQLKTSSDQITLTREPEEQTLSSLRLKSGRSNLQPSQRSLSHSCSDKILRWCTLGLLGSLSPLKINLDSVVCAHDPTTTISAQELALVRAIRGRGASCSVSVVPSIFESSRMVKKKSHKKVSASGQSINYNHFGEGKGKGGHHYTEVTVGATGALQSKGKKKSKKRNLEEASSAPPPEPPQPPSRLSRRSLVELSLRANPLETTPKTYSQIKLCLTSKEYQAKKEEAMKGVLKGWVCCGEANDFVF